MALIFSSCGPGNPGAAVPAGNSSFAGTSPAGYYPLVELSATFFTQVLTAREVVSETGNWLLFLPAVNRPSGWPGGILAARRSGP